MTPGIILIKKIGLTGGLACLLSSCYVGNGIIDPYIVPDSRQKENFYYVPASANVPLLTEKNDISASVQRSSGSLHSGVEVQCAYLPAKNIGVITSYSSGGNKKDNSLRYNRFEIGGGYLISIDSVWHFETYAGYGTGTIHNNHYTGVSRINDNYFFIQPAIAVSSRNKDVQLAFVSKFSGNSFTVGDTSFIQDREPFTTSQVNLLYDTPFHFFWEPGIIFRFGWDQFLLHTGFSFSTDITNVQMHRSKSNFSLGIIVKLNTTNHW